MWGGSKTWKKLRNQFGTFFYDSMNRDRHSRFRIFIIIESKSPTHVAESKVYTEKDKNLYRTFGFYIAVKCKGP